jgi:hypothetical protein
MLPKPTVPEGSRMVLNGVEFHTIHNFTTEQGNVLETVGGEYILPNGEPVRERTLLELLPDQHKQKALAWWDQRFGDGEVVEKEPPITQSDLPSMADLMAENQLLKAQIAGLQSDAMPGAMVGHELAQPDKDPEKAEVKRPAGRPKVDRGTSVLKSMGINV